MGIQKVRTSPYHAQTSWLSLPNAHVHDRKAYIRIKRQIDPSICQSWYMLTTLWDQPSLGTAHITGCLGADHAYPLTSTSLQYGAWRNTSVSTAMLLSYMNDCKKPSRKCKSSPLLRLRDRSSAMTERLMPFHLSQATWSWLKLIPTRGRRKWRTGGRRNHMKWYARWLRASLHTLGRVSGQEAHEFSLKPTFSHCSCGGTPLCIVLWAEQAGCATTTLEEQTSDRGETEKVPQSVDCLPPAQQQTAETSLGWVIGKLCVVLLTSSRVSTLDQG